MGRVYYSNTYQTFDSWVMFRPVMNRDQTGAIPFCLSFVEYYAPDYPNGAYRSYYEEEGFLKLNLLNGSYIPLELTFAEE